MMFHGVGMRWYPAPLSPLIDKDDPYKLLMAMRSFAERELNLKEYPVGYDYGDGKDEGFSTPNFPLGEFANAERREAAEKAGEGSSFDVRQDITLYFYVLS